MYKLSKKWRSWSHKLFIEWGAENKSAFQKSNKRDLSIQTIEKNKAWNYKSFYTPHSGG